MKSLLRVAPLALAFAASAASAADLSRGALLPAPAIVPSRPEALAPALPGAAIAPFTAPVLPSAGALALPAAPARASAAIPPPSASAAAAPPARAAAPRGDLALLQSLGSPTGLDRLSQDLGGRAAFDHARETAAAAAPPAVPGARAAAALDPRAGAPSRSGRTPPPPTGSGEELRDTIWADRVLPSAYGAALPVSNGGWRNALKALKTFLTLGKTFDSEGDELPKSRAHFKLLHPFGSVVKIRYRGLPGHPFAGLLSQSSVPGLARLSLGAPEAGGSFIPGTALKFFLDGEESFNAVFLGERTGVDGQQPDKNFFAQAFTNTLPKPKTRATKLAAFILGLFNHGNALRIPVDRFGAYRLLLKPAPGRGNPSDTRRDFREELADLKPGPLFEVYAAAGPDAPLIRVGSIEAESSPVASRYGDQGLFFRHRR